MTTFNSDSHPNVPYCLNGYGEGKDELKEGIVSCGCGEILESSWPVTEGWQTLVQQRLDTVSKIDLATNLGSFCYH